MDENERAYNQLIDGIIKYVDKRLSESGKDITFSAIVKGALNNNLYRIVLNGNEYDNIPTIGGTCVCNEIVRVLIPQGNYSNMVILKSSGNSGGGGSGTSNYNDLLNKPKINDIELSGNKSASDLGLQLKGDYALKNDVPTKTSQLTNDSGFVEDDNYKHINIDNSLSNTSENPVQNKIITERLNEVFQSVSNGKELLASIITDIGFPTDANDSFETMVNNIDYACRNNILMMRKKSILFNKNNYIISEVSTDE